MIYVQRTLMALALLLLPVGCGRPFKIHTATSFVELEREESTYEYRALTPDGVVVGVQVHPLDDGAAKLSFWRDAIVLRMQATNGYALIRERAVKSRDGTEGTELTFGHDQSARPHLYVVRLFLAQGRIFVAEAGGKKESMQKYAAQVDQMLGSLKVRCDIWLSPVLASRTCNRW